MTSQGPGVISCAKGGMYRQGTGNSRSPSPLQTAGQLRSGTTGQMSSPPSHKQNKKTHTPLSRDYVEQVRPFIDLIDKLRHYGLDEDVQLPAVAVIGDQSAGKSSALEAISGIQLPRGSGIVTRCPLNLILKSTVQGDEKWSARIQYKDQNNEEVKAEISSPEAIGNAVREAQDRIAGTGKGISHKLITLEVVSEDVPDLTLIDLPGIVRVAAEGQPVNIGDQIKRIIEDQIKKQTTIILAVVPANQDIETTEALKLAQQFDSLGARTLGVVTKPDLIDKGAEGELIAVLNNTKVRLDKGYTAIKCRGQQMIRDNISLQDAIAEEEQFFKDQPHFEEVDKSLLGVKNLSKKLTAELVNQIKATIPNLQKDVAEKINATQEALASLGRGIPTDVGELNFFCVRVLQGFIEKLKDRSNGHMFSEARDIYNSLLEAIAKETPDYGSTWYLKEIEREADKHRGKELPRFMNYKVCEKLIRRILKKYHQPVYVCLQRIDQLMEAHITMVADESFEQFPRLNRMVKSKVAEIRQGALEVCKERIQEILEMEEFAFSQDRIYCHDLDIVKETHRKMEEDRTLAYSELPPTPTFQFNSVQASHPRRPQSTDAVMAEQLAKGHRLSSASMSREAESDHKRTTAKEMFQMIQAYMEVSIRRLGDYVPMTISLHIIHKLTDKIQTNVMAIVAEPDLSSIVFEDSQVVSKRESLRQKLSRLEKARLELVKF